MMADLPLLKWKPNKSGRPKAPPRGKRAPAASEFKTCCALADTMLRFGAPGWLWTHFPAGEHRHLSAGARLKRMGLKPGWPDYQLVDEGGQLHFLEMKRRGEALTEAQAEFRAAVQARGVPYAVCFSWAEAVKQLQLWGFLPNTVHPQ
jgi:hypothetical protein